LAVTKGPTALTIFASNVRGERKRQGITQETLAAASGITASEVSRIERGLREPRLLTIVRVANGLGVAPSDLLNGVGPS
jgi:transcriptional regulator with XRE-family HTH domain